MVNNASLASSPQGAIDVSQLPTGEDVTNITPGKIWMYDSSKSIAHGSGGRKPVEFFNVPSTLQATFPLYQETKKDINDYSGIPSYVQGSGDSDAGETASGMAMLMNSANKVLRDIVRNIDRDCLRELVQRTFHYNMMYDPDESIKGDVEIIPEGVLGMFAREYERGALMQMLQMMQSPEDMQLIGLQGRAHMLKELARLHNINPDDYFKSEEDVEELEQQMFVQKVIEMLQEQGIIPPEFSMQQPVALEMPEGEEK